MFSLLGSIFFFVIIMVFAVLLLGLRLILGLFRPRGRMTYTRATARPGGGGMLVLRGRVLVDGRGDVPIYEDRSGNKYIRTSDYDSTVREIASRASTSRSYVFMVEENGSLLRCAFYPFRP